MNNQRSFWILSNVLPRLYLPVDWLHPPLGYFLLQSLIKTTPRCYQIYSWRLAGKSYSTKYITQNVGNNFILRQLKINLKLDLSGEIKANTTVRIGHSANSPNSDAKNQVCPREFCLPAYSPSALSLHEVIYLFLNTKKPNTKVAIFRENFDLKQK